MPLGFDADQDCSDVADTAVAKGVVFVCRYLKNLSLDEAQALSDAGLKIVSIWETTAQRALSVAACGSGCGSGSILTATSRSPMTLEVGYCLMLNDGTAAHDGARQGATRRG